MDNNFEKAFKLCSNNLWRLPPEYKKWKSTLEKYRVEWGFLCNNKLKDDVAQRCMTCDYLFSLYLWLKPKLVLEEDHRLVIILLLGSIYEGVLRDILLREKAKSQFINNFIDERWVRFINLIEAANKSNLINDEWKKYLESVNNVRNYIHLSSVIRGNTSTLSQKHPQNLLEDLERFKQYIKNKYEEDIREIDVKDIPL